VLPFRLRLRFRVGLGDSARTPAWPLRRTASRAFGVLRRAHHRGSAVQTLGRHSPRQPLVLHRRGGRVCVSGPERPARGVGARVVRPQEPLARRADPAGRSLRCGRHRRRGDRPARADSDRTSRPRRRCERYASGEYRPAQRSPRGYHRWAGIDAPTSIGPPRAAPHQPRPAWLTPTRERFLIRARAPCPGSSLTSDPSIGETAGRQWLDPRLPRQATVVIVRTWSRRRTSRRTRGARVREHLSTANEEPDAPACAPETYEAFQEFSQPALADGALPATTKQLIAVALVHTTQCPTGSAARLTRQTPAARPSRRSRRSGSPPRCAPVAHTRTH
jgi:hypothetical protein